MKYPIIALAILLVGCDNQPPTVENIGKAFQKVAETALKNETPGDIKKKDFSMVVYMPDRAFEDSADKNSKDALAYMCGRISGRDGSGWRGADEPVVIMGSISFNDKKITNAGIEEFLLVNRIADSIDRRLAQDMLDTRCSGQPFTLENVNYTAHMIHLN